MHYSKKTVSPIIGVTIKNIFIFSIGVIMLGMASCSPSLRFAPVKYGSAEINRLLDSTDMRYLTLQSQSQNSKSYKDVFILISYASDSAGNYLNTTPFNLEPEESKKGKNFKTFGGKLALGDFIIPRDSIEALLKLPKTGERWKTFDYLQFTPKRDSEYNYLYFEVKAVGLIEMDNKPTYQYYIARPCPPATNCIGKPSSN